jgi:hypothetical protein
VDTFSSKHWELTYDEVWSQCASTTPDPLNDEHYPASLQDAVPFFRKHRLKLVAVNQYQQIVMMYDPNDDGRELNHRHSPAVLRLLVHQGHAYKLNNNLASFDQTVNHMHAKSQIQLSTRYHIREKFEYEDDVVIDDFHDIYHFITSYTGSASFVKIICNDNVENVLKQFRDEYGIIASNLTTKSNTVSGFTIFQYNTIFKVCNLEVRSMDSFCRVDNEHYRRFMDEYATVYRALANKNHKSTYHPQFRDVLHYYM